MALVQVVLDVLVMCVGDLPAATVSALAESVFEPRLLFTVVSVLSERALDHPLQCGRHACDWRGFISALRASRFDSPAGCCD